MTDGLPNFQGGGGDYGKWGWMPSPPKCTHEWINIPTNIAFYLHRRILSTNHPIYNGAKPEYPCSIFLALFRILRRSVFLAAFRGLRCAFCQLHSFAFRPTSVRNNGITKTATFGSDAEKKGKELPDSGYPNPGEYWVWAYNRWSHEQWASKGKQYLISWNGHIPNTLIQS